MGEGRKNFLITIFDNLAISSYNKTKFIIGGGYYADSTF